MKLKDEREKQGLSQNKLAAMADMHPSTISQIEKGRYVAYPSQLEKLARALDWNGDPAALVESGNNH